jgi:hypothetical protein
MDISECFKTMTVEHMLRLRVVERLDVSHIEGKVMLINAPDSVIRKMRKDLLQCDKKEELVFNTFSINFKIKDLQLMYGDYKSLLCGLYNGRMKRITVKNKNDGTEINIYDLDIKTWPTDVNIWCDRLMQSMPDVTNVYIEYPATTKNLIGRFR